MAGASAMATGVRSGGYLTLTRMKITISTAQWSRVQARTVSSRNQAAARLVMEPNLLVSLVCLPASLASSGHLTS